MLKHRISKLEKVRRPTVGFESFIAAIKRIQARTRAKLSGQEPEESEQDRLTVETYKRENNIMPAVEPRQLVKNKLDRIARRMKAVE